jgi:deoxyribonuclease-4
MQIFSKSPRGWAARPLDLTDVAQARQLREELGIRPFAVHASYLINLAAADPILYERSMLALSEELERCRMMGADFLVLHVGCAKPGQADGLERISRALRQALQSQASCTRLLLENTAGQRGEIGARLEALAELLSRIGSDRLGICLDTCHTFAAGYDLRTRAGVNAFVDGLEQTVGLSAVEFIHLNDSKKELACHVDRHEDIGQGAIGQEGFRAILRHAYLRRIPMVLETPKESDADDLRNLHVVSRLAR